jgi:hypothetical protein
MDVGQAEIPACVVVSKPLVIEAEEVENGGMKIVNVNGIFDSLETEFIGSPINLAAFHSPPR